MRREEEPDVFVTVRMPQSLRDRATELARKSERTLAAEIRLALRERLRKSQNTK